MGSDENSVSGPEASEDAEILNDVISVCRDGEQLYRHVADRVSDQQSRNIFLDMARVRCQIVKELQSEVALRGAEPRSSETVVGKISRWYVEARSHFVDYKERAFIDELEETEERSLKILRTAVRKVEDKTLVYRLSSLVATFQMAHDRMRLLKASYK
ncbi:MAG: hypothetical protein DHS20C12_00940 [Pseudohongiella sp.]|nr:MAG: hypothetical protein DHS20C12_00940 [Pseudohongiella sp.]